LYRINFYSAKQSENQPSQTVTSHFTE